MTPPEEGQTQKASNSTATTPDIPNAGPSSNANVNSNRQNLAAKYKEKYRLLSIRCAIIQQENEEMANQITTTKTSLRRARKLRAMLIRKLDADGDDWRSGKVKDPAYETKAKSASNVSSNISSSTSSTSASAPSEGLQTSKVAKTGTTSAPLSDPKNEYR